MFKCQHTGKTIGPNVPENRVVVAYREMTYENVIVKGPEKGELKMTRGTEIAKEMIVGPDAYRELTGEEPRKVRPKTPVAQGVKPMRRPRRDTRPAYRSKDWKNPRSKGKRSNAPQEHKKPVVQVINRVK